MRANAAAYIIAKIDKTLSRHGRGSRVALHCGAIAMAFCIRRRTAGDCAGSIAVLSDLTLALLLGLAGLAMQITFTGGATVNDNCTNWGTKSITSYSTMVAG